MVGQSRMLPRTDKFVAGAKMVSPTVAGHAYAHIALKAGRSIARLVLNFDNPRLPVPRNN